MTHKYVIAFALVIISCLSIAQDYNTQTKIIKLENLTTLSKESHSQKKPILLVFLASSCPFCEKLEENILKPMIRSGDYKNKIFIRSVNIDETNKIIGYSGELITARDLQKKYDVFVTPTVLLIDHKGKEIAERQLGINSLDYYGYYLDIEIEKAIKKLF